MVYYSANDNATKTDEKARGSSARLPLYKFHSWFPLHSLRCGCDSGAVRFPFCVVVFYKGAHSPETGLPSLQPVISAAGLLSAASMAKCMTPISRSADKMFRQTPKRTSSHVIWRDCFSMLRLSMRKPILFWANKTTRKTCSLHLPRQCKEPLFQRLFSLAGQNSKQQLFCDVRGETSRRW